MLTYRPVARVRPAPPLNLAWPLNHFKGVQADSDVKKIFLMGSGADSDTKIYYGEVEGAKKMGLLMAPTTPLW